MTLYAKDDLVAEIIARADIVEIVSEHLVLTKKGKDYWGICPFHPEKTPSFSVSAEKKLFYCFGCQMGGNVITFIRSKDNLTYSEAIDRLAERLGIERRPGEQPLRQKNRSERERFFRINSLAASFFSQTLASDPDAEIARQYLAGRGISQESIKKFHLGYAPKGWDKTLNYLVRQGFLPPELERYGLVSSRTGGGGYYDRFRGRLVFPIHDHTEQVVGFGARSLEGEEPKYLNSPESRFFEKGANLYGLEAARRAIAAAGKAILVEGYLDALSAHQFGINNTVATMGTALTPGQLQLLLRYASEIILVFDSDEAGRNAAVRAGAGIRSHGGRVKVVTLPDSKDPDEFLQKHGGAAFREMIEQAADYLVFKLRVLLDRLEHRSTSGKLRVIDEFWPDYQQTESELEKLQAIQYLALKLQVTEETVRRELKQREQRRKKGIQLDKNTNIAHTKNGKTVAWELAERQILRFMLEDGSTSARIIEEYGSDIFITPEIRCIAEACARAAAGGGGGPIAPSVLVETIGDEASRRLLLRMSMEEEWIPLKNEAQKKKALDQCIQTLTNETRRLKLERLGQQLIEALQAGDLERSRALEEERKTWGRGE
ncbi:MAG: DNA primase, partial [Syntrophomonadaceae bacterium]|nr:DNA primase [Syntrophomonadaceae bacterium]